MKIAIPYKSSPRARRRRRKRDEEEVIAQLLFRNRCICPRTLTWNSTSCRYQIYYEILFLFSRDLIFMIKEIFPYCRLSQLICVGGDFCTCRLWWPWASFPSPTYPLVVWSNHQRYKSNCSIVTLKTSLGGIWQTNSIECLLHKSKHSIISIIAVRVRDKIDGVEVDSEQEQEVPFSDTSGAMSSIMLLSAYMYDKALVLHLTVLLVIRTCAYFVILILQFICHYWINLILIICKSLLIRFWCF